MSFLPDPRRRRVAIVLLLFALSVLVRLSYLNRPLSSHHEGLTAHVLRTQQIWREAGALKHGFRLVCTYPGKADRNIHNGGQLLDPGGSYYKSSLPPFAYIFPYLVFRFLGVRPDVLPIQVFGLLVHLVTCVFVLLLVKELTRPEPPSRSPSPRLRRGADSYPSRARLGSGQLSARAANGSGADGPGDGPRGPPAAAMVAFTVYLFSPQTLWYHSNVYAFGMLALPLFVAGILLSLKIADGNAGPTRHALLGLVTFLMVYTDWLGVFFAFSVFAYALCRARERRMRPVLYVVAGATAAGLALTVWQYSRIAGLSTFLRAAGGKYLERSGFAEAAGGGPQVWDFVSWKTLCGHYVFGYLPFLIVLYTLACVYLALLRKRPDWSGLRAGSGPELLALYLCAAPVALHHLVFFNYTSVHDYSVLKTGVFVAVLCGLLYHRIMARLRADASDDNRAFKAGALATLVVLMAVMSVVQYLYLNRDGHDRHLKMGREIARVAKSDEVVFVRPGDGATWRTVPQITFYAHRNIALWAGEEKARALLERNDCERGAVFVLTGDNGAVARVEYVDRGRRERPGHDTTPFNRDRQDIQD